MSVVAYSASYGLKTPAHSPSRQLRSGSSVGYERWLLRSLLSQLELRDSEVSVQ